MASAPPADHDWSHSRNGYQPVVDVHPDGVSYAGIPVPTRLWGKDESFDYPLTPALDQDVPRGEFKDDLCDCTRNCMPSCFGSCCCGGWLIISQLADRLGLAPRAHVLAFGLLLIIASCAVGRNWLAYIGAACTMLAVLLIRRATRKRYAIQGSMLRDVCSTFWCTSCVLSQAWRHVFPHRKAWHWSKLCDPYAGEPTRQQQQQQQQRGSSIPTATIV